jgi:phosphohistidine phosphatase SixA
MTMPGRGLAAAAALLLSLAVGAARADEADGSAAMVNVLRQGGFTFVMRHAASPAEPPAGETPVAPGNSKRERQLDDTGKHSAAAMGAALRRLNIPVSEVLTSPAFRARETAAELALGKAKPVPQLGEGKQGMKAADKKHAAWLRGAVAQRPAAGNRLIITHGPIMAEAFGVPADGIADGETLIIQPLGKEGRLVARVKIESWPDMK